ncbi:MFS transporter, DHA1 family, bicyclomycin/chloramphenicol resistance protein [Friedmanniella luteola]|uniref:MFS transporter, DHA1 family, bicyclomycin/chloramphenicol resistance protein n=1 Tax=Friedmanniella luteola TaxID=546871 RepID=A0A1H1NMG2_9ACTN|nr:multidrug effflux MFS transporter [Friedmanniella luteola]SDR99895.1 MFS transporter, DHA1 family, bicyclomycin/chloramphenicol resistance protein [Friedmanniella luteola]
MTSVAEPLTTTDAVTTAGTPATRYVGRRYLQLVLVLGALSAIGPLTIDAYLPALPALSAQMGATDSQAQLTITGLLLGLGLGQLLVGPLSDAVGRRKPLLIGLAAHGVTSLLCAVAPSITMLAVTRTLQGLAGAAVAVVSMAVVRDLFSGIKAAQLLSRLMLVVGVAPILAPSIGSALLSFTSWRGIFVVLAAVAVGLFVLALVALPETLPVVRRQPSNVLGSLRAYRGLFTDRLFVIMVLVSGLMFATLFAYISGAPFILQELYGLSPAQFGVAFSANALGLVVMTQVNPLLIKRYSPVRVLLASVTISTAGAAALVVTTATGFGGFLGFMVPLFFVVSAAGLSFPNAPAIALNRHGEAAGSAAALLGSAQFMIGGAIAPLVGALANGTPVPMAGVILGASTLALVLFLTARRALDSVSYE